MPDNDVGRRAFLARMGVLGAAVATGVLTNPVTPSAAAARAGAPGITVLIEQLSPVLAELAKDTLNGLVVMACPGPDAYSKAQGTPRTEPGAIEARATDFLIANLDAFVPFPEQLGNALTKGLANGLDGTGTALPSGLAGLPSLQVETLDDALTTMLENDETLPLSVVIAMLLNLVATQVNPVSVNGAFLSPFARLSYPDKCKVFELLEGPDADLVRTLDADAPEPFKGTVSGLLEFLAGALLEFAAFGSYSEWGVFDQETRTITERPVGWKLCGYQPNGVVHGWDEFIGYYQGRQEVEA